MCVAGCSGRAPYGLSCSAGSTLPHFPPLSIETRGDLPPLVGDSAGHHSYHLVVGVFDALRRPARVSDFEKCKDENFQQIPGTAVDNTAVEHGGVRGWGEVGSRLDGGAVEATDNTARRRCRIG